MATNAPVIETQAQFDQALQILVKENGLPADQRDPGTTQLAILVRDASNRFDLDEGFARASSFVTPDFPTSDGGFLSVSNEEIVQGKGFVDSLTNTGRQVADLVSSPFRSEEENLQARRDTRFTAARNDLEREAFSQQQGTTGIDAGATFGEIAPDLAAGGAVGLARSAGKRIAGEAALGAAGGVLGSDNPGEDAAIGAFLGGGIGTVLEAPEGLKAFVFRDIQKAKGDRRLQAIQDDVNIPLDLAELSLDERVKQITRVVPITGTNREKFINDRMVRVVEEFDAIERQLNPASLSTATVIEQSRKAYEKTVKGIGELASLKFRESVEPAVEALGATFDKKGNIVGGQKFFDLTNVIEEYKTQLEFGKADGKFTDAQIKSLDATVAKLGEDQAAGGWDLGRLQRELRDLSADIAGSGNVLRDRLAGTRDIDSRAIMTSVLESMDGEGPAALLKEARDQYAQDMDVMRGMQGDAIDRLLNKVGADPSRNDFASRVMKMDDTELKQLMNTVDMASPGLGNAIRGRVFKDIAGRHTRKFADNDEVRTTIDTRSFLKEFEDMGLPKLEAFLDAASPTHASRLKKGIQALQRIERGAGTTQAGGLTALGETEAVAINATSLSAPFVARLLASTLTPSFWDRALYSQRGRVALDTLGTQGVSRAAAGAALTDLAQMMGENDERQEELKRRAELRRRIEGMTPD